MKLAPRATEPGLWVNPDWHEGTPGTFAVILGISAYTHLAEGDAPATETFGLGQLKVSALTAFAIFRWLTGNRSASENLTLAIRSPYGIPCPHGNTTCITPRGVGTDSP